MFAMNRKHLSVVILLVLILLQACWQKKEKVPVCKTDDPFIVERITDLNGMPFVPYAIQNWSLYLIDTTYQWKDDRQVLKEFGYYKYSFNDSKITFYPTNNSFFTDTTKPYRFLTDYSCNELKLLSDTLSIILYMKR